MKKPPVTQPMKHQRPRPEASGKSAQKQQDAQMRSSAKRNMLPSKFMTKKGRG